MIKKYFFEKSSSNINNLENVKETILEKLLFSQKDQKKNNFDLYDEDLWFKLHYGMTRQEFIQKYSNNLKTATKAGAFTTFINNVISKFRKIKERINLWRRRSNT